MVNTEKIQLLKEPYNPEEVHALLDRSASGAVLFFDGIMKEVLPDGSRVTKLEWDAYEEMARKILEDLRKDAIKRFELIDLVLVHRLDAQYPGDLIMTLGVSSQRRLGAIQAIAWFMDELKKLAPLWKREQLAGGEVRWVGGKSGE